MKNLVSLAPLRIECRTYGQGWGYKCAYLSPVPIIRLSKDVSAGTEIVFKYSPNSQYPASINYEE